MTSTPSTTSTVKTVNNKTGVTTSTSTTKSGASTTTTKTTTIGKAAASTSSAKSVSTPSTLAAECLGSQWICGPNDSRQLCAPVAVANALLGATGIEAPNWAIERLYAAAGGIGDTGVPIASALNAARTGAFAGCLLKSWRQAGLDDADILLLQLPEGLHSAAFAGMNVISWGAEIPLEDLNGRILGAWSLTWHGTETR